jgi:hypothetical protein
MSFSVDPEELRTFATALRAEKAAVAKALTYVTTFTKTGEGGLLFSEAYKANEVIAGRLRQVLAHLESILHGLGRRNRQGRGQL